MRGLATGEDKDYKKFPKLLKKSFVFLNEYTTSVKAEHDPRGPEGPYQFQERSVPVLVIKKWDGETLAKQFGFPRDPVQGRRAVARHIDKAVKKNGPIVPPKELRKLQKSYDKGAGHLKKGRISAAIREFQAVLKGAQKKKKMFDEPPTVVQEATARLKELREQAEERMGQAATLAQRDPKAARKEYQKLLRDYGGIAALKGELRKRIAALPKE